MKISFLSPYSDPTLLLHKRFTERIATSTAADEGNLYIADHENYYQAYVHPASLKEAKEWVENHNTLVNSPLMKALS